MKGRNTLDMIYTQGRRPSVLLYQTQKDRGRRGGSPSILGQSPWNIICSLFKNSFIQKKKDKNQTPLSHVVTTKAKNTKQIFWLLIKLPLFLLEYCPKVPASIWTPEARSRLST